METEIAMEMYMGIEMGMGRMGVGRWSGCRRREERAKTTILSW